MADHPGTSTSEPPQDSSLTVSELLSKLQSRGKKGDDKKNKDKEDTSYKLDIEKRITEAFEVFDHAGNKTVDVREVGTILRSLGCVPTEAEIQELILNVEDQENAGSVNLDRFLPYVAGIINEYKMQPASADDLLKAFLTLDIEGLGFLTKDYMTKALMEGREPFTQEEIDEMMDVAVDPRTGHINYMMYINQIMVRDPENIYLLIPKSDETEGKERSDDQDSEDDIPQEKREKKFLHINSEESDDNANETDGGTSD